MYLEKGSDQLFVYREIVEKVYIVSQSADPNLFRGLAVIFNVIVQIWGGGWSAKILFRIPMLWNYC